ncbi:zinc finger domain-containing protein [Pelagibius litoralis]|uniref:zinc finger domain-containing protein n=1 Tax=Pelagibius litoralis TaxID=374515 RepID=UPI00345F89A2
MTYEDSHWLEDEDEDISCPTCKGSGYVNPLTAPKGFFCVSTTECPHCDGTGETQ